MASRIRIGLFGVGHLGKIHLKLLQQIPGYEVVGFYDPNDKHAQQAETQFQVKRYNTAEDLIKSCDAFDIVSTTSTHFDLACQCIRKGKHVFIEKPLATTVAEAQELVRLADEAGIKAMVGHVERFNPAMLALEGKQLKPVFIEVHRLAEFNPRGTDVSVVMDLMIHDIDIILSLVKANVKRISASGVAIVSKTPDIANARIEFDNGCVANVTASRVSMKSMRKMRVFQPGAYISVDFLKKKTDIIHIDDTPPTLPEGMEPLLLEIDNDRKKYISFDTGIKQEVNAIQMELELFLHSITHKKPVPVSLHDGLLAMQVGQQILDKINKQLIFKKH